MRNKILTFAASLCLLCACGDTGGDLPSDDEAVVTVIFYDNGLGDLSYCDNIYWGLCRIYEKCRATYNLRMEVYTPNDSELSDKTIDDWFKKERTSRELLILTTSKAIQPFAEHPEWKSEPGAEVLLLDCDREDLDVYTGYVTLYGVSYFTGVAIKEAGLDKAAVVMANRTDKPILESAEGFADGFRHAGGSLGPDDTYYFAEESSDGYAMPDEAYRLSYNLNNEGYQFIIPVCGGSSQGIYRYARRYESDNGTGNLPFYSCGLDVDQQLMSSCVLFSIVKKYDILLENFVGDWLEGRERPKHQRLMLDSGFADVIIADGYKDRIGHDDYERMKGEAIAAERAYYSK